MHRIKQLIHEVHRRSLWQVLAVYAVGSWAAYQVIIELTHRLGLPDWVPGFTIVLFLIGLPIVLATAFVQEGLPSLTAPLEMPADPTLLHDIGAAPERRVKGTLLEPARQHFFLTWQRSVVAGITAFLLLMITAGSYVTLREAGVGPFASLITSGALEQRDRVLVAQLQHTGPDSVLAAALTEALRVDLAQSPVISIVESRAIGEALQRMGRSRQERVDSELGREIAIREGVKAVLEGEIAPAGDGYIITARLVRASTGELLVTHRESAATDNDVIAAIDRMSRKLRETIGESLKTIRSDAPLAAVTTSSLTALQKYTAAARALDVENDLDRGIAGLLEAVAEDSTFAMAWRKLGVAYYNSRAGRNRVIHATTRAYELRERLTERERYQAIAFYHLYVTDDTEAAVQAYRALLDVYPDDRTALNNIAIAYGRLLDDEKEAEFYQRAIEADSFAGSSYTNLVQTYYRLGRIDDARATLAAYNRRFGEGRDSIYWQALFAYNDGEYDVAERGLRDLVAASRESPAWRARAHMNLGHVRLLRGDIAAWRRHIQEAAQANAARGVPSPGVMPEAFQTRMEDLVLHRPDLAVRRLDALLASEEWRRMPQSNRPYLGAAMTYARSGRTERARQLLAEWDALPREERGEPDVMRGYVDGWLALSENRPQDAVASMRAAADADECRHCGLPALAMAYESAGARDSAIATYRRALATPALPRVIEDGYARAYVYERLAELYEAAGDRDNAIRYAGLFTELWKNAAPELQPRVKAKQELLQRLSNR